MEKTGSEAEVDVTVEAEVDEKLLEILNDDDKFECYINSLDYGGNRRNKTYQTVIINDLQLGFIIKDQNDLIGVFDNQNQNLGKFISENEIIPQRKSRSITEEYTAIDIRFHGITKDGVARHKNLGRLVLLSLRIPVHYGNVPHHIVHPVINTADAVKSIEIGLNSALRPSCKTLKQALEYIKTDVLKTDNDGFGKFLHNISLLSKTYKNHAGIHIDCINFTESYFDMSILNRANIELSKY